VRSIRVFAKNLGDPYYEPTIVVHDAKKVLHEDVDSTCHLCHHCDETLDHLLSSCEVLARHNNVAMYIH